MKAVIIGAGQVGRAVAEALAGGMGWGLERWVGSDRDLAIEDGFRLVLLTWTGVCLLGSLPYLISGVGSIGTPMNAFFESVSGFTATGSGDARYFRRQARACRDALAADDAVARRDGHSGFGRGGASAALLDALKGTRPEATGRWGYVN